MGVDAGRARDEATLCLRVPRAQHHNCWIRNYRLGRSTRQATQQDLDCNRIYSVADRRVRRWHHLEHLLGLPICHAFKVIEEIKLASGV